ncbi:MAG TPA: hypothetical protein VN909_07055 [Candidatus Dormibacteraeota bacterium]|nr:hypothetical protein [Candidatus Dormibacteraeota bacterium]
MNQRFVLAIGAFVIAAIAFVAGYFIPHTTDVNPIGFHARGQVQMDKSTALDPSSCYKNGSCTLVFDFWTSADGNVPADLPCAASSNCMSFRGINASVAGNPNGTQNSDTITGRVLVGP